ncbi:MAG: hypothetical protein ACRDRH_28955 [Pseudonocardia sp.]
MRTHDNTEVVPRPEGVLAPALSYRDRAILRAVAGGTAELLVSVEPDLFVDGLCCSDQVAAHRLAHAGLIAPAAPAAAGQRVRARLTLAGQQGLLAS